MNSIRAVCFCLVVATPAAAAAQSVYRCVDGTTISYQWHACALHETEQMVFPNRAGGSATGRQDAAADAVTAPLPQRPRTSWRAQVRSASPYVGITDLAVLNMRGWGRPHKITRERGERSWHEHWIYRSPDGSTRHLHFGNGTLLAMSTEPPPYIVQVASVAGSEAPVVGSD